jgi:hypothetical protein
MDNTHAKLVGKDTGSALQHSQEIQVKAILGRFSGDIDAAADYCWNVAATAKSELLAAEYRGYMQMLIGKAVAA